MTKKYELSFEIISFKKKYSKCDFFCYEKFHSDFQISLNYLPKIGEELLINNKLIIVQDHKKCFPQCTMAKNLCYLKNSIFYGKYK